MKPLFTLFLWTYLAAAVWAQPHLDYYWVGTASNGVQGSGNWRNINSWRIGSVNGTVPTQIPISSNNVYFEAAAFPTALPGTTPVVITVDGEANCKDFIWDNSLPVLTQKIVFQSSTPRSVGVSLLTLEVLGEVNMPSSNQVDFDYNGNMRLLSGAPLVPFRSNGQKLYLRTLVFSAGSDTTEFRLMDPLYLEDPRQRATSSSTQGGLCILDNGYLNFNGHDALMERFYANANGNPSRGLNIAGSRIRLIGHGGTTWTVNFNAAGTNYRFFDAAGSHLIVQEPTGGGYGHNIYPGYLTYDSLTIDGRYTSTIRTHTATIRHLFLNNNTNFSDAVRLTVENLYIKGGYTYRVIRSNRGRSILYLDHVVNTATCDRFVAMRGGSGDTGGLSTINPNTNLVLDRFILHQMEGDISNGSTYTANNSVDAHGNANITINSVAGREMRFRFSQPTATTHYWHNLANWEEYDGANWIAASCLPTPVDNVHFDAASFPATGNQRMRVDSTANCHDMRWDAAVDNRIEFYTYLYTRASTREINFYGTMELSPNMRVACNNRSWNFWGNDNDSIISNYVYIGNNLRFQPLSEYEIAGNYTGRALYGLNGSYLKFNNNRIDLGLLGLHRRQMHNVEVNLGYDRGYAFRDYGGFELATSYTGNTTFHFWGDRRFFNCNGSTTTDRRVYFYGRGGNVGAELPNTIVYADIYAVIQNITVHGDLFLHGSADFREANRIRFKRVRVLGDQPGGNYNGDMTFTTGKNYLFDSYYSNYYAPGHVYYDRNSKVEVAGTFTAVGTCDEPISIRTINGNPMTWNLNLVNISNVFIEGMDVENGSVNAANSVDGGNNNNVNFITSGTGVTLYWRAHYSDPTDFEGIWQDPGHWTTNPANLVGDSACLPTTADTVIFDNLSFSATSNQVTIDELALCKTMWIKADVALTATSVGAPTGQLIISESLLIDVPLSQNTYTGIFTFMGNGGVVRTSGTTLVNREIEFRQVGATWDLLDDFRLNRMSNTRHGILSLVAGTLRTNNHTLHLHNGFRSIGQEKRTLDLGTSTVELYVEGRYTTSSAPYAWYIPSGHRNITVLGENSVINFYDNNGGAGNVQAVLGVDSMAYQIRYNSTFVMGCSTLALRVGQQLYTDILGLLI